MSATGTQTETSGAANTVKSSYGQLVDDPLALWQPVKDITENWGDVLKLASTDDQTGSSVQPTDDLRRHALHDAVTVVDSTSNEHDGYSATGVHRR